MTAKSVLFIVSLLQLYLMDFKMFGYDAAPFFELCKGGG
jgi:hypothetical protein